MIVELVVSPVAKLSISAVAAISAGAGLLVGAFIPGVLRKVKSVLVRVAVKIVKAAEAEASKVGKEVDAEAAKIDKKL